MSIPNMTLFPSATVGPFSYNDFMGSDPSNYMFRLCTSVEADPSYFASQPYNFYMPEPAQ